MTDMTTLTAQLEALRLPDLQARYALVTGEPTRNPNRKSLVARIVAATEAQLAAQAEADAKAAPEPTVRKRGRFAGMDVPALQALYLAVVGRPSGSVDAAYLRWKVTQAEKGRITVGPARASRAEAVEMKVLPLRLEVTLIAEIDAARERLGLKSRVELVRAALEEYLAARG